MPDALDIGPVELVVLSFPGTRIDAATVDAFREVISSGTVTLLDLVYVAKQEDGSVTQVDVDEQLGDVGLDGLAIDARALISDDDLDVVRDALEPGTAAVVIVYEQTWARSLASRVRGNGGEVTLHVQIPRAAVEDALKAATTEQEL